jgi:hypothetical protein
MFITERQNYNESALFLLAARSTLSEVVNASKSQNKKDLVEFIHNEASDFEIMSLLTLGVLPKVKYSAFGERLLFSRLKEQVMRNFSTVVEHIGESTINTFLHEVDSVYPRFSTQKPIMEFYASVQEQGSLEKFLGGGKYGPSAAVKTADPKATEDWAHTGMGIKGDPKDVSRASHIDDLILKVKKLFGMDGEATAMNILTSPGAIGIGATALAALVTYGAYKVYKNYFSKAAKACAGQKGDQKDACMAAYRNKAKQAQAKVLMKGLSACKNSKDPAKCKAAIQAKISKIKK